jgi:hypothetical protein
MEDISRKTIARRLYPNGYIKELYHYNDITKEEYATICQQRVEMFVIGNRRIMNPIDTLDQESYFLWIKDREETIVACVRIIPPHLADVMYDRQYSIWDKGWINDGRCHLFPVQGNHDKPCLWTPQWGTIIQGCEHAIMDLYEPGHLYVNFFKDQMPGLKYLGTQKDKYGYDGWQWVWEPVPQKDVKHILRKFIESQIKQKHKTESSVTT